MMDAKLAKVDYSPQSYLKSSPRRPEMKMPRPKFDVSSCTSPNAVHQADLFFFLLHDTLGRGRERKTYKYALTVVDVAMCFKETEPLTSKASADVAKAFQKIYKRGALKVASTSSG